MSRPDLRVPATRDGRPPRQPGTGAGQHPAPPQRPGQAPTDAPVPAASGRPGTGCLQRQGHAPTGAPDPTATRQTGIGTARWAADHAGHRPGHAFARQRPGRATGLWSDRGSATLELAVLAPGLLLLIALIALAGRYAVADGAVDQAAAEAARAASLQRTPAAGRDAAAEVARSALAGQGLSCLRTEVDVDVSGLRAPPGQRGRVTVTVRCPLRVADLPLRVPAITLTATAVSPVDTYRER
ncbi:TadE/TadG family type IV pilus assembly protein [Jiangella rhizosphaerae]|uniref:TadE-like domain-containing protein n=1 Tax=Jiangella rhizosphaerae TaxID=2293569 RepID=A0A418KMN7_9ACTN|nr:TadE/TadG family type IV pilus assembly protein [Jiangella rhizosphaerae]RIQ20169.1 hypothetical protein DY240_19110 [Jiangella rhizosphaerae]